MPTVVTKVARLWAASLVSVYGSDVAMLVQSQVVEKPEPASMASGATVETGVASVDGDAQAAKSVGTDFDVSSLVSKPEAVFKQMGEQVGTLNDEMNKIHQRNQIAISQQQNTFAAKLTSQQKVNHELAEANNGLNDEVVKLTQANRQLWQQGKDLQKENERERVVIKGMQAKIADASEFASNQMKILADIDSLDETVIRELDALDIAHQDESLHKQSLDSISSLGTKRLSMLAAEADVKTDPSMLLKVMQENLAHMDQEQKASENELKAIFFKKFEAEAMEHKKLLDENARLKAKKASLMDMNTRLTAAVKHLEDIRDSLRHVITSLGVFSEKVGKESMEEAKIVARVDTDEQAKLAEIGVVDKKVAPLPPAAALTEEGGEQVSSARAPEPVHEGGWLSRTWTRLTGGDK